MRRSGRVSPVLVGLAVLLALLFAIAGALALERGRLEGAIKGRIEGAGASRGVTVRLDRARLAPWPPLRLDGLHVEKPGGWTLSADEAFVLPRLLGRGLLGRARIGFRHLVLSGPAGLSLESEDSVWDLLTSSGGGMGVELHSPERGLRVLLTPNGSGGTVHLEAKDFKAGEILSLKRDGVPILDAGTVEGRFDLTREGDATGVEAEMGGKGVRLASLAGGLSVLDPPTFGQRTDVALRLRGSWRKAEGALDVPEWHATIGGAALSGSLTLDGVGTDPRLDLVLNVERVEFARLFRTSGLDGGVAFLAQGLAGDADLGSASLSAHVAGKVQDPTSFTVVQKLDFTPPKEVPKALLRLRSDFVYEVALPSGGRKDIEVSPSAADFIELKDVPPLFLRTLLIAEDANFYGHRGIDLSELPSAVLTNWSSGGAIRGASTITQQLAKNLFLSRDKNLGRKLKELSLALLLESTLSKQRILEIYLNVIEWGPSLYGLRPAAHRYFHREPSELSPTQMAFLVAIIPGPIKYQRSITDGTPTPALRELADRLLVKLRSIDALSEEEYEAARAEPILVDTADTPSSTADPSY